MLGPQTSWQWRSTRSKELDVPNQQGVLYVVPFPSVLSSFLFSAGGGKGEKRVEKGGKKKNPQNSKTQLQRGVRGIVVMSIDCSSKGL